MSIVFFMSVLTVMTVLSLSILSLLSVLSVVFLSIVSCQMSPQTKCLKICSLMIMFWLFVAAIESWINIVKGTKDSRVEFVSQILTQIWRCFYWTQVWSLQCNACNAWPCHNWLTHRLMVTWLMFHNRHIGQLLWLLSAPIPDLFFFLASNAQEHIYYLFKDIDWSASY